MNNLNIEDEDQELRLLWKKGTPILGKICSTSKLCSNFTLFFLSVSCLNKESQTIIFVTTDHQLIQRAHPVFNNSFMYP